jgi:hypothetical protein
MREYIEFNVDASQIFGHELHQKNNHFLFYKPKTMVFHKCLMDLFDKVLGMHVGNTILVDHNHVKMMRSPIENVMLVEKCNGRVDIFPKYLMGEVLIYLEAFHSTSDFVFTFVQHRPFGTTWQITRANTKF